MKLAAFLCGLIAGLFALVAPFAVGTDMQSQFLAMWPGASDTQQIASLVWYGISGAAVLGGLIALAVPSLGAILLLGAALVWLGLGFVLPGAFDITILVPLVAATIGAGLAIVAAELRGRARRAERDDEYGYGYDERWDKRSARREKRQPLMSRHDEEAAREAALRMDPLLVDRDEAPPQPEREIPLTLDELMPARKPRPIPRQEALREPTVRSPGFEPPKKRSDKWPETPIIRSIVDRPSPQPEKQPAGWPVWIATASAAAVVVLGLGLVYMVYDDGRFGGSVAKAGAAQTVETASIRAPAGGATKIGDKLPPLSLAPVNPQQVDPPGTATLRLADIASTSGVFTDPFSYCAAVGTIDYVDARYVGPQFTPQIANTLHIPATSSPDRVSWRCVNGVVMACTSFDWPVCDMTPTANEMLAFCEQNPSVPRLLAPNGLWSCEGGRPKLPDDASWPVDDRGFFPTAWIPVTPPSGDTASAG